MMYLRPGAQCGEKQGQRPELRSHHVTEARPSELEGRGDGLTLPTTNLKMGKLKSIKGKDLVKVTTDLRNLL
jgi:hypothetical protein